MKVTALLLAWSIAFVPLDDRPVTSQLPQMLGRIAGINVLEPPRSLLGNYLAFGKPDAIREWLNRPPASNAGSFVVSTDMLAYGGLVASRVPGVTYDDAYMRLGEFSQLRAQHPHAWIGAFGTVMRLAPTGVPDTGAAAAFFAPYPQWSYLQQYANLHDPPQGAQIPQAEHLRSLMAPGLLDAYLQTRQRNYGADLLAIGATQKDEADALVLGQDDAGPVGLHVKEVRALQNAVEQQGVSSRVAIEPGADELGMALVAHAIALHAGWTPRIAVRYSRPDGAQFHDPLEYAPVDVAIGSLIALAGGVRVEADPDITLYVRVPHTSADGDTQLENAMAADERAGRSIALADLTFLEWNYNDQAAFAERLLRDGVMSGLDAYSSWNTNANTVGTALAEAVVAGAARRLGSYHALAHKEFTFNRIVDDYAFHDYVRPQLNAILDSQGVSDHTYLLPDVAAQLQPVNRAMLWNRAAGILPQLYPGYHIAAMKITLPWNRTFETEIDASLAPNF